MQAPLPPEVLSDPKLSRIMRSGSPIRVRLSTSSGKRSEGEVRLQEWDRKARGRRALRTLGICWGLAIVTVFIPLAHFVLVPGFLIAGPIAAFVVSSQERAILGGFGSCPGCGKFLPLVGGADKWPRSDLCSGCQTQISIERI